MLINIFYFILFFSNHIPEQPTLGIGLKKKIFRKYRKKSKAKEDKQMQTRKKTKGKFAKNL